MDKVTDQMLNMLVRKILDNLYQDDRFSVGIKSDDKSITMLAKHYLTMNLDDIILQSIKNRKEIVENNVVKDILLDSISSSNGEDYTVGKFTDFH